VLEEIFGIAPRGRAPDAQRLLLTHDEDILVGLLDYDSAQHVDDLARLGQMPISKALPVLLELEMKGLARQLRGLRFLRAGGNA
jgi:hypothetical protein